VKPASLPQSAETNAMFKLNSTFGEYLAAIGLAGQISALVFVVAICFGALIHLRRLPLSYRLAFIPLSFLPLVLGIFGLATKCLGIVHATSLSAIFDVQSIFYHFGELLQIIPLVSLETTILLALSSFLFVSHRPDLRL